MKPEKNQIRPYGDHLDDGKMQLSFTLPMPAGELAKEAARLYLEKLGFENVQICWMEPMGEGFCFFTAYGHAKPHMDISHISLPKPPYPILPFEELVKLAREKINRRIVVVGATTGSDAHTVGLDAILSIKGVAGDKGLEYYPFFRVVNLRAQVSNEELIEKAAELKADAILVSQMVTQQDQHLANLKDLKKKLQGDKRFSSHLLRIAGGPKMDHRIAKSIGFDAGFGPGTKPSEVANYVVHELAKRLSGHTDSSTKPQKRSLLGWLRGN